MSEQRELTAADQELAVQLADVDHAVPTGVEEAVDTGAEAGERAAAVARMEGFTKRDWRELRLLAAEGRLPGVYGEALMRRTEAQYPGLAQQVAAEYAEGKFPVGHPQAGKLQWTKPRMVQALFHGHKASAASIGRWEDVPKRELVKRLTLADLCGVAEQTAVEETTGRLWVPSAAQVRRHGG